MVSSPRKITVKRASARSLTISSSAPIITVAWVLKDTGISRVLFHWMISRRSSIVNFRFTTKLSSEKKMVPAPKAWAFFTSRMIWSIDLLRYFLPVMRRTSQKSQLLGQPRLVCNEK